VIAPALTNGCNGVVLSQDDDSPKLDENIGRCRKMVKPSLLGAVWSGDNSYYGYVVAIYY